MKNDLSKSGWVTDPASGLDVVRGLLGRGAGDNFTGFDMFGADPLIDAAAPSLPAAPDDERDQERNQE